MKKNKHFLTKENKQFVWIKEIVERPSLFASQNRLISDTLPVPLEPSVVW